MELVVYLQAKGFLFTTNFQQLPLERFKDDSPKKQQQILFNSLFCNQIVPNYYHFEAEEKLQDSYAYLFDLQKLVQ